MMISIHNRLFGPGGCLTPSAIRSYLDGSLGKAGKVLVDEHTRNCALCAEALQGYKSRGQRPLHSDLEILSRRIRRKYSSRGISIGFRIPVLVLLVLLTSILILLGIFYILQSG